MNSGTWSNWEIHLWLNGKGYVTSQNFIVIQLEISVNSSMVKMSSQKKWIYIYIYGCLIKTLSRIRNLSGFNILKSKSYSSLVGVQPFNFSHGCHIWTKFHETFLCQRLHCHVFLERIQGYPTIHPCISICWKDMVCPTGIIPNTLWCPRAQEHRTCRENHPRLKSAMYFL